MSASRDPELEMADGLLAARRVGDINAGGKENKIDGYVNKVEQVLGPVSLARVHIMSAWFGLPGLLLGMLSWARANSSSSYVLTGHPDHAGP